MRKIRRILHYCDHLHQTKTPLGGREVYQSSDKIEGCPVGIILCDKCKKDFPSQGIKPSVQFWQTEDTIVIPSDENDDFSDRE